MKSTSVSAPSPPAATPAAPARDEPPHWLDQLTPREVVAELDKYIVGQSEAKKAVAIALRNRWRRQQVEDELRDEILPNNLIMIGPTGVGKTEIARRLARLAGSPFVKVEASKFTEVGYVGRDVESMVRDLVDTAVAMVRAAREDEVEEEAVRRAEERMLDLLLPDPRPADKPKQSGTEDGEVAEHVDPVDASAHPQVFVAGPPGGTGKTERVDPNGDASMAQRRARTREKLRRLLQDGHLEDRTVDLDVQQGSSISGMMFPVGGMEGMDLNFTEMLQDMLPRRSKRRTVTVAEARRILIQEELERLVDMDEVVNEALDRAEEIGIIFLDELDKVAGRRGGTGPDVSREGVQRDLLPIVEGCNVQTKYGFVRTDHMLFIAAGAFHVAKPSDLIPELAGALPHSSGAAEPQRSGIRPDPAGAPATPWSSNTAALVETEGASLEFTDDGIRGDRAHCGRPERPDGEHRCAQAAHGAHHPPGGPALRPSGRGHRRRRSSSPPTSCGRGSTGSPRTTI